MAEDDAPVARPRDTGGINKLSFTQTQNLTANQAGQAGPDEGADHQGEHERPEVLEGLADDRGEKDQRDDDDHVGEAHENRVDPPAEVTGDGSDEDADGGGDGSDDDGDHDRLLGAAHDPGEGVTTDFVLTERMRAEDDALASKPSGNETQRGGSRVDDGRDLDVVPLPPPTCLQGERPEADVESDRAESENDD